MTTIQHAASLSPSSRPRPSRPHWSYSQIAQYLRCPLQYFFERVARLPRPCTPSSLAFGSAIHAALAHYHRRLQANLEVSAGEVAEAFRYVWQEQVAERPVQFRETETASDLVAKGTALLELYVADAPPDNILAVEQMLTVPLRNSQGEFLDKPFVAVLDLLRRDAVKGLTISEFKTSARRYPEFEADGRLQATCYAYAVQEQFDELPRVEYTVLVKTKTLSIQRIDTARSDADFGRLGDIVQVVERGITAKAFYPIESTMNCAGCPFRIPCRDWQVTTPISRSKHTEVEAAAC